MSLNNDNDLEGRLLEVLGLPLTSGQHVEVGVIAYLRGGRWALASGRSKENLEFSSIERYLIGSLEHKLLIDHWSLRP